MDANRLLATLLSTMIVVSSAQAQFQTGSFDKGRSATADSRFDPRASQTPNRVVKNLRDFIVPFEMTSDSQDVTEVQLHVSADAGKSWQLYKRQAPGSKGFPFRASRDGEYWFAVRTIGQRRDNNAPLRPELRVVVDTELPRLNMRLLNSAGQASVDWLAEDEFLDASSFRLQYQNQDGTWLDIPFDPVDDQRTQWQGQSKWWLRTRASDVMVKAEIRDRAGNVRVVSKRMSVQPQGNEIGQRQDGGAGRFEPRRNSTVATPVGQSWDELSAGIRNRLPGFLSGNSPSQNTNVDSSAPFDWEGNTSAKPWSNRENAMPPTEMTRETAAADRSPNWLDPDRTEDIAPPSERFGNPRYDRDSQGRVGRLPRRDAGAEPAKADSQADRWNRDRTARAMRNNDVVQDQRRTSFDPRRETNDAYGVDRRRGSRTDEANVVANRRRDDRTNQPAAERRFDSRRTQASRVSNPVSQRRPFETSRNDDERMFQPRITASPNFELVYDLYGVRENDARQIELWMTRDRGRSWELYGSDDDRQSPIEVRMKSQGLYGFQLIVDSGRGEAPLPPRSGDDADVWVVVDWTKPTGRITRVELPDRNSQDVTIEWSAEDVLLAETPITLSFASNPNGPWTPFARDIPNAGAYYWRVDQRLPERLYIQMQVRDMAGNVTADVYNSGGDPSGRIRDVRPLSRR